MRSSPTIGLALRQPGLNRPAIVLGCFALGSVALWAGFGAFVRPACAARPDAGKTLADLAPKAAA